MSLLLGVIQRSNEISVDDKQPIFGRQSVSLLNFFVAEDIVHVLPNFVATWNPPFKFSDTETFASLVKYSGADFWENRGFNDKSVKTSKIVHLDLLIKIGYGPIK